jgi:hypothetical protein
MGHSGRVLPVSLIFTSGVASGVNCYAAVLVLGLLGRFGHIAALPAVLERPSVLAAAELEGRPAVPLAVLPDREPGELPGGGHPVVVEVLNGIAAERYLALADHVPGGVVCP